MSDTQLPTGKGQFTWWQKALGILAVVLLILVLKNPEAAAFTFLLDAALLDVFILLVSVQLRFFGLGLYGLWFALKARFSDRAWSGR